MKKTYRYDKSNGCKEESSDRSSASTLNKRGEALAVATLFLTAQGEKIVESGKLSSVDPHWFRGLSYLKIGWEWVKSATARGFRLISNLHLSGQSDPEPAKPYKNYIKPWTEAKKLCL